MVTLKVATWNINGLASNIHELESIIMTNKLDIVLISESHATARSNFRIKGYNIYTTPHPDGKAHAGTSLVIRANLKHSILEPYSTPHLQATSIKVEDRSGHITFSSVYCPPRHTITSEMFSNFFQTMGLRFVAGGDWNGKHTYWGARCTSTRGRQLKRCVDENNLNILSTGEPTYWPSDPQKLPDLLDFFITHGISYLYTGIESSLDGSSDHTPVILTLGVSPLVREKPESLTNRKTDWAGFKSYLDENINLLLPFKTRDEVDEACRYITNLIQVAAWSNTPAQSEIRAAFTYPLDIKQKILDKRRLRRIWHQSRHPLDKTRLNRAIKELKVILKESVNESVKKNLESLSPSGIGVHSLWKATKNLRKPQQSHPPIKLQNTWARTDAEKAEVFAAHLAKVFTPNVSSVDESDIDVILDQDLQMSLPITPTSPREITMAIKAFESGKAPGYDLITPTILKNLPRKGIVFLTCLFNAILRTSHFPALWKTSQVVMIHKPGKPEHEPSSYRPISLTPILSKLWERIFLTRLKTALDDCAVIPTHQFGFRKSHSTVEQVHRVYHSIRQSFECKKYCSAAFLDVQQAFDRVWHKGLLVKIKENLPHSMFTLLASYLSERTFQVKQGESRSSLQHIEAGVPQGSVLGPVLYNIFTSDLPVNNNITVATYADDIAYLSVDDDPANASHKLQEQLNATHKWLRKWRIRTSAAKSNHITFSLRKGKCPPVRLGDEILPHSECVKYLGFHLDRRLTWKYHIKQKRDQINHQFRNMYWLMGRNSALSIDNKLLIYNSVLKPIWTYGIQIWGVTSKSNILCLQRVQNCILRAIVNAPWFTRNSEIHEYLNMPTVASEIERYRKPYLERLSLHQNPLVSHLLDRAQVVTRLKRGHIV